ncbi:MAG: hypothetical protein J5519_01045 [Bacteroidales bacterium]|nr:hypothetical protein [Bacteroidales bacterium]
MFFEQPGGVLALAGAFLTQLAHYPVLGAALFALLLCLLTFLTEKAIGLEGRAVWLSTLPALFLLLFITRLDYSVYLFRTYGLLYSQVLGFCVASALVLLYRKCFLGKRSGPLFVAAVVIIGYPLFGAFALLSALLMALLALRKQGFTELAVALLLGASVPWLCRELPWIFPRIHRKYVYFAALPYMEFLDNFICLVPLMLAGAATIALCFLRKAGRIAVPVLLGVTLLIVVGGSYWDRGFHTVLGMEKAVSRQDWDKVLKLAKKEKNPNRIHVLYRNVALYETGALLEKMFQYPDGDAPLHTLAQFPISNICGVPVLYYCGMINPSDRLAMEYSSTFCKNIHYYKYQAKTALVSGEYELARKYLDMVDANWFEGKWVRRYRAFLENPALMDADEEFQRLCPLLRNSPKDFEASGPLQEMLFAHFENPDYINEAYYEWQTAFYLIQKDADRTLYSLFNRLDLVPDAPVGMAVAEGAALFGSESGDMEVMRAITSVLRNRNSVLQRFTQFSKAANNTRDSDSEETKEWFAAHYGGTYWYYYLFVDIYTKR